MIIKYSVYKIKKQNENCEIVRNHEDNLDVHRMLFQLVDDCIKNLPSKTDDFKISNIVSLLTSMKRSGDWGMSHYCHYNQYPLYTGDRPHAIYANVVLQLFVILGVLIKITRVVSVYRKQVLNNVSN